MIVFGVKVTGMNELKTFTNEEFGRVRTIEIEGEPWFVAVDVCRSLEIANTADALKRLDDDERMTIDSTEGHSGHRGGAQQMNIVNESGLYSLVLGSRKPEARNFKRWITHEIIPSIRKTGGYQLPQGKELLALAVIEAQKVIEEQRQQLIEQKPLVEFAEHVSQSKDTIDMEKMAKVANDEHISIGRNRLVKWLKEKRVLMESRAPYQEYINRGYFDVIEVKKDTVYGTRVFPKTVITGKGQIWIIEKLRNEYKA